MLRNASLSSLFDPLPGWWRGGRSAHAEISLYHPAKASRVSVTCVVVCEESDVEKGGLMEAEACGCAWLGACPALTQPYHSTIRAGAAIFNAPAPEYVRYKSATI